MCCYIFHLIYICTICNVSLVMCIWLYLNNDIFVYFCMPVCVFSARMFVIVSFARLCIVVFSVLHAFILLVMYLWLCVYGWALREQHTIQKTAAQLNFFDLIQSIPYYSKWSHPNKKAADLFTYFPNANKGQNESSNIKSHYKELPTGASQFPAYPA